MDLQECVAYAMSLAIASNDVFTWLIATHRGAGEICIAALANKGISPADMASGYDCDPTTKSTLGILAIPGLIMRLSRNLDKGRGFVNGAFMYRDRATSRQRVFYRQARWIRGLRSSTSHGGVRCSLPPLFLRLRHDRTPCTRRITLHGMYLF